MAQASLLTEQPGRTLCDQAVEKWGSSIDRFFADLEKHGITVQSIRSRSTGTKRVIIGWAYEQQNKGNAIEVKICKDLELTLAILSRCVNQIYFQNREPDFSWNSLFSQSLSCRRGSSRPLLIWRDHLNSKGTAMITTMSPEERNRVSRELRSRVLNVLPAATYQMDRFLSLVDITVSDITQTAAMECGPQPVLHLNHEVCRNVLQT